MAVLLPEDKPRTLRTAEVVLQLIKYMADAQKGVQLTDVASHVGKSKHTAYYLMNTLCQEGFAFQSIDKRYRLTALARAVMPRSETLPSVEDLRDAAHELHLVTRERIYLVAYQDESLKVVGTWGKQGQPGLQGLGETIREEIHALAVGKAIFSELPKGDFESYTDNVGLRAFTPKTIADPETLWQEILESKIDGVAFDKEEFAEGFCCLAIPVKSQNETIASLGMAVPVQRFAAMQGRLVEALKKVHSTLSP